MGRSLEQVDMTSRLVASASLAHGSTQWPAVLRGCGGHDAFLRTYRGLLHRPRGGRVLDRGRPVPAFDHARADRCCRQPAEGGPEQRADRTPRRDRRCARLVSSVLDWSMPILMICSRNLNHEMSVVQDVMAQVTITVATSYFAAADPTAWTTEGTR